MNRLFICTMTLALSLVFLTSCDNECDCSSACSPSVAPEQVLAPMQMQFNDQRTHVAVAPATAAAIALPNITGAWSGRWESTGHKGHGGGLKCAATEAGVQKWAATFTAEYGPTKSYQVKLEGKPGDGAVMFGGSVDLGKADGGTFTWTGKATQTEFTGKYEGGGDSGTFKMSR